eukprot:919973-Amphidinium_carterae.2
MSLKQTSTLQMYLAVDIEMSSITFNYSNSMPDRSDYRLLVDQARTNTTSLDTEALENGDARIEALEERTQLTRGNNCNEDNEAARLRRTTYEKWRCTQ